MCLSVRHKIDLQNGGLTDGLRKMTLASTAGLREGSKMSAPQARLRGRLSSTTTRHGGYAISQRKWKRVEEIFGWIKTIVGLRKTRHLGKARVGWMFTWAAAA